MTIKMFVAKFVYVIFFFVMILFLNKASSETCINFFKNQENLQDSDCNISLGYNPDRYSRYNTMKKRFENLEYLKPNQSALCSVDFTDDLKGKTLKVAVDELSTYITLTKNNTIVTGFMGEAWTIIQDALKFRSVYTPINDMERLKTGEFDVMLVTSIFDKQATVYFARSTVIDRNSYSLFAVSEGTFVSKWWYTRIFDVYVWILSTLFVILLTLSMVGIYYMKKKWCTQTEACYEFGYPSYNLLCILGAMSSQGFQEIPRSWSLRICSITALGMGMLLSCGFNSTLTSYLAFRAPYVGINELDDLWKTRTHSICVRNRSLAYKKLNMTIQESHDILRDKSQLQLNRKCPDMENEMELRTNICRPGFVYVETPDVFLKQYRHVQDKCQIVKVRGSYWSSQISFLHYRGSKYWKTINSYLLRLHSSGIIKYLEANWTLQHDLQHGIYSNYQEVELDHVQLLIIGLIIAMIISIIICIFENIWFRLHDNHNLLNVY